MGPLAWIGLVLFGLVVLVVLVLAVPVQLELHVERRDATRAHGRLGWLFGLVHVTLFEAPSKPEPEPELPAEPPEVEQAAPEGPEAEGPTLRERVDDARRKGRATRAALSTPGFTAALRRLLGRLLRSVHLGLLRGWLRFGTGDPAETGATFGYLQAAMPASQLLDPVELTVEPDFDRPAFEAEGDLHVRTVPLRLIGAAVAFALTPATWRAVRAYHSEVRAA